jgi:uncharacterized membrane protein YphA (DoxX/SURF4 family)
MNTLQRIALWGDRHHPWWIDIVRIFLGFFLVYKGVHFLENTSEMISLMSNSISFSNFALVLIGHFIVFAHILGGLLLAAGVLTRFAALIQIPILLGAIILINASGQMMQPYSELLLAIVVLLLLIYFLVAGNGPLSLNWEEKKRKTG